jgi:hypothetical protein
MFCSQKGVPCDESGLFLNDLSSIILKRNKQVPREVKDKYSIFMISKYSKMPSQNDSSSIDWSHEKNL